MVAVTLRFKTHTLRQRLEMIHGVMTGAAIGKALFAVAGYTGDSHQLHQLVHQLAAVRFKPLFYPCF